MAPGLETVAPAHALQYRLWPSPENRLELALERSVAEGGFQTGLPLLSLDEAPHPASVGYDWSPSETRSSGANPDCPSATT
ncbi:hypothetical protein P7K49_023209 [Saguinus oedipus]|uniref:Uncharacterized protein n=1 Tax=Saguinus oedipus TaxID=9490 RepID=A0ABQ9UL02_SAGOE|nr:hypothetical protein P7K49_023209 [Saguinus oedipus]